MRTGCLLLLALLAPVVVAAQQAVPASEPRVHLGPFDLTPSFWATSGYDTNISRESSATGAGGGYQTAVIPQVDVWWRLGPVSFGTASAIEILRVIQTDQQSSNFNHFNGLAISVGASALTFTGIASHRNHYARPTGFEIGERSRRIEDVLRGGFGWKHGRLAAAANGGRLHVKWDAAAVYQGSNLQESLNRTSDDASASLEYELTPLTSATGSFEVRRDRFEYSPVRDGDSLRVLGGVALRPQALFSGNAQFGYMHFTSPQSGLADFKGLVGNGVLGYEFMSSQVLVGIYRDLFYSYDTSMGYYLMTSIAASYRRSLLEKWEVKAYAQRAVLDYRYSASTAVTTSGEVTRRTDLGGLLAYRVTSATRIGVNTSWMKYTGGQNFHGFYVVAFITYGNVWHQRLDSPLPDDR